MLPDARVTLFVPCPETMNLAVVVVELKRPASVTVRGTPFVSSVASVSCVAPELEALPSCKSPVTLPPRAMVKLESIGCRVVGWLEFSTWTQAVPVHAIPPEPMYMSE
jgi:hypothetical protein